MRSPQQDYWPDEFSPKPGVQHKVGNQQMFVKGFKQDRFPSSWSLMEGDTAGAWVAGRETSRQGGLEAGPKRVLSACWEGAWGPPAFPRMPSVFFLTSGESLRELWVSQCSYSMSGLHHKAPEPSQKESEANHCLSSPIFCESLTPL